MSREETIELRYGKDFYRRIGSKGGKSVARLYGKEYLKMLGSRGGNNAARTRKTRIGDQGE